MDVLAIERSDKRSPERLEDLLHGHVTLMLELAQLGDAPLQLVEILYQLCEQLRSLDDNGRRLIEHVKELVLARNPGKSNHCRLPLQRRRTLPGNYHASQ